jgi:hypothetical protein
MDERFDAMEKQIERLQKDIVDLKIEQGRMTERLERLTKRAERQDAIDSGVVVGTIIALLGVFAKLLGMLDRL